MEELKISEINLKTLENTRNHRKTLETNLIQPIRSR